MSVDAPPHRPSDEEHQAALDLDLPRSDEHATAMLELAGRAFSDRDYERASKILKSLVIVRPGDARIYEAYGSVYQAQARSEDAERCFEEALRHDADSLRALLNLGEMALRKHKDHKRAKAHLERVLELDDEAGPFAKRARSALKAIEQKGD